VTHFVSGIWVLVVDVGISLFESLLMLLEFLLGTEGHSILGDLLQELLPDDVVNLISVQVVLQVMVLFVGFKQWVGLVNDLGNDTLGLAMGFDLVSLWIFIADLLVGLLAHAEHLSLRGLGQALLGNRLPFLLFLLELLHLFHLLALQLLLHLFLIICLLGLLVLFLIFLSFSSSVLFLLELLLFLLESLSSFFLASLLSCALLRGRLSSSARLLFIRRFPPLGKCLNVCQLVCELDALDTHGLA